MFLDRWIPIEPIQIQTLRVQSVIATAHTVRVQDWDDFEHKMLPELSRLLTLQICEQIDKAVKHMRSRSLARMHSGSKENYLLVREVKGMAPMRVNCGRWARTRLWGL